MSVFVWLCVVSVAHDYFFFFGNNWKIESPVTHSAVAIRNLISLTFSHLSFNTSGVMIECNVSVLTSAFFCITHRRSWILLLSIWDPLNSRSFFSDIAFSLLRQQALWIFLFLHIFADYCRIFISEIHWFWRFVHLKFKNFFAHLLNFLWMNEYSLISPCECHTEVHI